MTKEIAASQKEHENTKAGHGRDAWDRGLGGCTLLKGNAKAQGPGRRSRMERERDEGLKRPRQSDTEGI